MGHCEIDKYADKSYRALFDTRGEWFCERHPKKLIQKRMPAFDLLCGGFPCQTRFSIAGSLGMDFRRRKRDRCSLSLPELAEARKPAVSAV